MQFDLPHFSRQTENSPIFDPSALFGFEFFEIVPIRIRFEHGDRRLSPHKHQLLQLQLYFIVFEHSRHFIRRLAHVFASNFFEFQTNVCHKSVVKQSQEIAQHQNRKEQIEKCAKRDEHNDRVH